MAHPHLHLPLLPTPLACPPLAPVSAVNQAGYGVLCTINGFWYEQHTPFITQPSPVWAATQHANNPSQPLFWWVGHLCRSWYPSRLICTLLFALCVQDGRSRVVRSMGCRTGKLFSTPGIGCNRRFLLTLSGRRAFSLGATRLTCCMDSPASPPTACQHTIGA